MPLKHIITAFFIFLSLTVNAQLFNNNVSSSKLSDNSVRYIIPVKFWIIKDSEGNEKTIPSQLKELINELNYYYSFNNTRIQFSLRPDYVIIKNDKLVKLNYFTEAPFQSLKRKSKACINVIITDKLTKKKFLSSRKKDYAGTFNPISHSIIIARHIASSSLSHEIGHYLGLKHPHRGWKYKLFQEPVSRTRVIPGTNIKMCERRGDGLSDTPAEPNLTKYTDSKCNYTGWNVKDRFGDVYKPNTHNIMSYTKNRECRNKFTKQQIALMLYTLSKNKYAQEWRTDLPKNKMYLPDAFEPDNHKETATEIIFNKSQTHSFHHTFSGKRKTFIPDTTDWLYFNLDTQNCKNLKIEISKTKNHFSDIKISVFFNNKLISKKKLTESSKSTELKVLSAKPGKYYIKIQQIVENETEIFYKINVIN